MQKIKEFVTACAVLLVTLFAWCGIHRHPAGSPKRPPYNAANVQFATMGFTPFFVPLIARVLHLLWAPVAALLTVAALFFVGAVNVAHYAIGKAFPPAQFQLGFGVTLTTSQVLLDVIQGFRKWFPAFSMLGTAFQGKPLKLNQTYIAHITSLPTASTFDRAQGGYKNGANSARGLLADVPVYVDGQPTCPLLWQHLDQIKDNKNDYQEAISGAGYVIAKGAADTGIFAKMTTRFFSRENVTTIANCDYDWLQDLVTAGNTAGQLPTGRVLFVNSAVANILAVDPRMISKDYAGQQLDGNAYRQWRNVGGFALIQEYPDLPSNNGTALTALTGVAATDVITKVAHGLVTGDPFVFSAITGGAGLAITTKYWVIKVDADTFKLASTYAGAIAGTTIDFTTAITAGTGALQENLIAFAADKRAFGFLAGLPEGMQSDICEALGIPRTMVFETITEPMSGQPMAAAKWQEGGTGDAYFVPTFVYGTHAGKQGAATTSAAAAANLADTGCDKAGIRITSGAS